MSNDISDVPSTSLLDAPKVREFVLRLIEKKETHDNIARAVEDEFGIRTSRDSIRRARKRWGLSPKRQPATENRGERPRHSVTKDKRGERHEIVGEPTTKHQTPEDLMRERGLDPDEWDVTNLKVNKWNAMTSDKATGDNRVVEMVQLTINLVPRKPLPPFLQAARTDGPSYRDQPQGEYVRNRSDARFIVMAGDQQAPFHDETMHELFCQWLEANEPDEGILIGDTVDFPDISRHRYNPERTATVQSCVNSGYAVLRDYVESAPRTRWTKLPGNHDERIRNTLIDWACELYGVTKAQVDDDGQEPAVLSVESLLRLDELNIEYVDPNGQYDQAQVNLSPYLAVRHGWLAVKGAGASALKTLEHLGYSIVVGHTHRQSIVHQTKHDIDGTPTTLVGVEAGCMCNIDGLGYSVAPDWQNGFATATIWPDGVFKIDLATYFDGTLVYGDQRYGELRR